MNDQQTIFGNQSAKIDLTVDQQTLDMCVKSITNFGSTTYQNICTGQTVTVPFGALDWIGVILVCGGGFVLIVFLGVVLFKLTFE